MLTSPGAGAGQAIEDGYILGRSIHDYLSSSKTSTSRILEEWTNLYQSVRLPRAQKVQRSSRVAGDIYEMQTDSMKDSEYDDCIPQLINALKEMLKWVWTEDIDKAYENQRLAKVEGPTIDPS